MSPPITRVVRAPARAWLTSLPFRVIVSTFVGSIIIMVLGGFLLVRQASTGILAAKRQASVQEASTALDRMQQQLRQSNSDSSSIYERLNQLATEVGSQAGQYRIIIQGPVSGYASVGVDAASVPDNLARSVESGGGMYLASTLVRYTQPGAVNEPGLVVGSLLYAPSVGESYPIYFIFPEGKEVQTLQVVQNAAATTGALLTLALTVMAGLVTRQVVGPVRRASLAAERLASGHLNERMDVRGTTELASLGRSINNMAAEIERQIGQLEELSRVQQQFVSDVSHELRTPLTTVKMAAELLYEQRDEFDVSEARSAELMHAELERFEGLLGDLLEISRFDAGAALLTLDETDLATVVRAEVEAQRAFADRLHTPLVVESRGDTSAEMDARRVRRIMRNLITNAIEHGEQRPIRITVAGDEHAVAVTVRDHGVGFLPSQSAQVFHRFWRADPSRNRTVGGTGLGLAIALEDARLHGGWLSAWGRPHQGAQFRLTLPRTGGTILTGSPLPLAPVDLAVSARPASMGEES